MSIGKRIWGFALAVAVLAASLAIWWFRRTPADPEAIAEAYREALLAGDTDTVLALAAPDEFKLNGMSRDDVDRFLNRWLRSNIVRGLDPRSRDVFGNGASGFQTYHFGVMTKGGSMPLAVTVAMTDDGLKVVQPITTIFVTFAGQRRGEPNKGGRDKLAAYVENVPTLAAELAPYHIRYIVTGPGEPPMSIEQFGLWSKQRLERVDRENKATSKAPTNVQ